jgi:hypothetical protein
MLFSEKAFSHACFSTTRGTHFEVHFNCRIVMINLMQMCCMPLDWPVIHLKSMVFQPINGTRIILKMELPIQVTGNTVNVMNPLKGCQNFHNQEVRGK